MPQFNIAGPGLGLPPPQNLYPSSLSVGAPIPYTPGNNLVDLAAGNALPIPAGEYLVGVGAYSFLQYLDPVTGIFRGFNSARVQTEVVHSDGFTRRVANMTGCPVAAVVTTAGSGYAQGTTTISVNTGNSTWYPIIGGLLTLTTISVAGGGYTLPPICILPIPGLATNPGLSTVVPGGVQATAVAAISSNTVSTITVTNQGAGYASGFTVTLLPDPTDPNIATITNAVAVFGITGAGTLAAAICTNPGSVLTGIPTLTVTGAGTSAALTPEWCNTILSTTVTAAGAGYQNNGLMTTAGGITAATATHTNPSIELNDFIPRQAQAAVATGGTLNTVTSIGTIYDSGLFMGTPVSAIIGGAVTTLASITFGLGGKPDRVLMQPA